MVYVMVEKNILYYLFFFYIGVIVFMIYFLICVLLKILFEFIDIY